MKDHLSYPMNLLNTTMVAAVKNSDKINCAALLSIAKHKVKGVPPGNGKELGTLNTRKT